MQRLELLAPAKNIECGKAAIEHGADAVYIGAQHFGARAAAGNDVADIAELCTFAHQFGAKVYVTVNTILFNNEVDDALKLIRSLNEVGVDAILVQDMAIVKSLTNSEITIHASTQTDNRSADKVKWMASLGCKRVVLARELSIEEIAAIHDEVPDIELEVFVHGALCVSYSGQCYASQHCFKRSANRGECAQFCRLAFTMKDATGRIIENEKHLLSLRDMCQIENLERLAQAGAVSFKIEGRLKDVDYVKNVTAAYSERLNDIIRRNPQKYRRASYGRCEYTFTPDLRKSFNRGFTTYFADGRQPKMASFDTPKAMGEYVGKVKEIRGNSFNVAGTASFANGDGLCFLDRQHTLIGFRVNRAESNRIFPLRMPAEIRPGVELFRNYDHAFNTALQKPTAERKLSLSMTLTSNDNSLSLKAMDETGRCATSSLECSLTKAEKPQEQNIRKQLSKLGGTIFSAHEIAIETDAFIPSSVLAQLRRDAVIKLLQTPIPTQEKAKESAMDAEVPTYPIPYLYNAANDVAKEFYSGKGVNAESFNDASSNAGQKSGRLLMQCRYCLRNEMGYCTKSGRQAPWKEPLTISISDGREFNLQFDCKHCQMNITAK